jgi:hypothetical protein
MKLWVTTSALALALATSGAAHAGVLQICVSEDGGVASCSATSSTGALSFSPSETNFANVAVNTSGVPVENNPDLATTDLTADTTTGFTGSHTLEIEVFQTGLASVNANLQSTFTVNGLIGTTAFAGPSTLSDFTGGTGTTLGSLLHTETFPAEAIGAAIDGPTSRTVTSDAQEFLVTFTQAGQSVTDTIQTIGVAAAVPEPSSLGMLGTSLLILGSLAVWRRRTR